MKSEGAFKSMWGDNPTKEAKKEVDWPSRRREDFKPEVYDRHPLKSVHVNMMFYYDLLPSKVRAALASSKINYRTQQIYTLLLGGASEDDIIKRIEQDGSASH